MTLSGLQPDHHAGAFKRGNMNKNVFTAVVWLDEAKAFFGR
jgi:hypothetical protein